MFLFIFSFLLWNLHELLVAFISRFVCGFHKLQKPSETDIILIHAGLLSPLRSPDRDVNTGTTCINLARPGLLAFPWQRLPSSLERIFQKARSLHYYARTCRFFFSPAFFPFSLSFSFFLWNFPLKTYEFFVLLAGNITLQPALMNETSWRRWEKIFLFIN